MADLYDMHMAQMQYLLELLDGQPAHSCNECWLGSRSVAAGAAAVPAPAASVLLSLDMPGVRVTQGYSTVGVSLN